MNASNNNNEMCNCTEGSPRWDPDQVGRNVAPPCCGQKPSAQGKGEVYKFLPGIVFFMVLITAILVASWSILKKDLGHAANESKHQIAAGSSGEVPCAPLDNPCCDPEAE